MNKSIKKDDTVIYVDDEKYPDKLLRKKPNGQIESIEYNELEREIIVLEVLELAEINQELQNKKNHLNINV